MWLENCDVDLDYHLRRMRVPSPGGRRELDEVIGNIASTPLDHSLPLWEFYFAEEWPADRFATHRQGCTTPWPTASHRRIFWPG